MALIKAYSHDKQILVSTHSDFVLDQVAPEHVYKTALIPGSGTTLVFGIGKEIRGDGERYGT